MSASPENKEDSMPLRRSTRKSVVAKVEEQVLTPKKRKSTATPLKNAIEKESTGTPRKSKSVTEKESVVTPRKTRNAPTPRKSVGEHLSSTPRKSVSSSQAENTPKKKETNSESKKASTKPDGSPTNVRETRRTPRKSLRNAKDDLQKINEEENEEVKAEEEITVKTRGRRKSVLPTTKANEPDVEIAESLPDSGIVSLDEDSLSPKERKPTEKEKSSPKKKSRKSVHFKNVVDEHQIESGDSNSPSPSKDHEAVIATGLSSPERVSLKSSLALVPKVVLHDIRQQLKEANLPEAHVKGETDEFEAAGLPDPLERDLVSPKDFLNFDDENEKSPNDTVKSSGKEDSSVNTEDKNSLADVPAAKISNKVVENIAKIDIEELKSPRRRLSYENQTKEENTVSSEALENITRTDNVLESSSTTENSEIPSGINVSSDGKCLESSNNEVQEVPSSEIKLTKVAKPSVSPEKTNVLSLSVEISCEPVLTVDEKSSIEVSSQASDDVIEESPVSASHLSPDDEKSPRMDPLDNTYTIPSPSEISAKGSSDVPASESPLTNSKTVETVKAQGADISIGSPRVSSSGVSIDKLSITQDSFPVGSPNETNTSFCITSTEEKNTVDNCLTVFTMEVNDVPKKTVVCDTSLSPESSTSSLKEVEHPVGKEILSELNGTIKDSSELSSQDSSELSSQDNKKEKSHDVNMEDGRTEDSKQDNESLTSEICEKILESSPDSTNKIDKSFINTNNDDSVITNSSSDDKNNESLCNDNVQNNDSSVGDNESVINENEHEESDSKANKIVIKEEGAESSVSESDKNNIMKEDVGNHESVVEESDSEQNKTLPLDNCIKSEEIDIVVKENEVNNSYSLPSKTNSIEGDTESLEVNDSESNISVNKDVTKNEESEANEIMIKENAYENNGCVSYKITNIEEGVGKNESLVEDGLSEMNQTISKDDDVESQNNESLSKDCVKNNESSVESIGSAIKDRDNENEESDCKISKIITKEEEAENSVSESDDNNSLKKIVENDASAVEGDDSENNKTIIRDNSIENDVIKISPKEKEMEHSGSVSNIINEDPENNKSLDGSDSESNITINREVESCEATGTPVKDNSDEDNGSVSDEMTGREEDIERNKSRVEDSDSEQNKSIINGEELENSISESIKSLNKEHNDVEKNESPVENFEPKIDESKENDVRAEDCDSEQNKSIIKDGSVKINESLIEDITSESENSRKDTAGNDKSTVKDSSEQNQNLAEMVKDENESTSSNSDVPFKNECTSSLENNFNSTTESEKSFDDCFNEVVVQSIAHSTCADIKIDAEKVTLSESADITIKETEDKELSPIAKIPSVECSNDSSATETVIENNSQVSVEDKTVLGKRHSSTEDIPAKRMSPGKGKDRLIKESKVDRKSEVVDKSSSKASDKNSFEKKTKLNKKNKKDKSSVEDKKMKKSGLKSEPESENVTLRDLLARPICDTSALGFQVSKTKEIRKECHVDRVECLFNATCADEDDEDDSDWLPPVKKSKMTSTLGLNAKSNLKLKSASRKRVMKARASASYTKAGLFSVLSVSAKGDVTEKSESKEVISDFTVCSNPVGTAVPVHEHVPKGFVVTHAQEEEKPEEVKASLVQNPANLGNDKDSETSSKINEITNARFFATAVLPYRLRIAEIKTAFCQVGINDIISVDYASSQVAVVEFSKKKSLKKALQMYGEIIHNGKPIYVLAGKKHS